MHTQCAKEILRRCESAEAFVERRSDEEVNVRSVTT